MAESKMKEVAKIFGVDLEEEFKIKYDDKSTYVFKEDGLFEKLMAEYIHNAILIIY